MTDIILHGILAKEFGEKFKMKIHKAKNVIKAIDVNRKNFSKRVVELSREGLNYTLIVDGKKITDSQQIEINKEPKEIHLVPVISGGGPINSAYIIFTIVMMIISVGLNILLAPKPDAGPPIKAATRSTNESFMFSNKINVANQGAPVPVGYGRLLVGSQVIQITAKSFPQNQPTLDSMKQNPYVSQIQVDTSSVQSISNRV